MRHRARSNILSTPEIGWPFLLRVIAGALALVGALAGQTVSASAWELQQGRLRISAPDSGNTTVRITNLGGLGNTANPVGSRAPAIVRQDHTEVHNARLTAARVARLATTDPD